MFRFINKVGCVCMIEFKSNLNKGYINGVKLLWCNSDSFIMCVSVWVCMCVDST